MKAGFVSFLYLSFSYLSVQTYAHDPCVLRALGGLDDGPPFLRAVNECSNLVIPADTTLNVSTRLDMTGLQDTHIDLQGMVLIFPDIPYWTGNAFTFTYQDQATFWLLGGNNITLDGGGTIDGAGQLWYDTRAGNSSLLRPIILTVYQASDVLIKDITLLNSPEWFNLVYESRSVVYDNVTISATSTNENGPHNSDGWDIYRSDSIVIQNSLINNGDDCVSFKPNSTNIIVSNLNCNGSHGISVGSLGQYPGEYDIVENVTAIDIIMSNASNGARIKAWAGPDVGAGLAKNIVFQNFTVSNVDFPLTIDQCYFTDDEACAEFPSNTYIEDIWFNNIVGTSSEEIVASLMCSPDGRCSNINVNDLELSPGSGLAVYACQNVNLVGNSASLFPEACREAFLPSKRSA